MCENSLIDNLYIRLFFHGRKKTQGQKNSSLEKTQALFQPKTQGTEGFFLNPGQKLNFNGFFWIKSYQERIKNALKP